MNKLSVSQTRKPFLVRPHTTFFLHLLSRDHKSTDPCLADFLDGHESWS
jgi:hypothetical protein